MNNKRRFSKKSNIESNVDNSQLIPKKKMSKKAIAILVSCVSLVLVASVIFGLLAVFLPMKPIVELEEGAFAIKKFNTKGELIAELSADGQSFASLFSSYRGLGGGLELAASPPTMSDDNAQEETSGSPSHSSTNVQVEGLDEADLVKVDGNYIYALYSNVLRIIRAENGVMTLVWTSNFTEENFYPDEILLEGDRLAVLGRSYTEVTVEGGGASPTYPGEDIYYGDVYYYNSYTSMIAIRIYDITNREEPALLNEIKHSGYYNTSRLSGTTLYYVAQYNFYEYDQSTILPRVKEIDDLEDKEIGLENVYYIDGLPQNTYTTIGKIDLLDTSIHQYNSFIAGSSTVYFSGNNIYLCDMNMYSQFVSNGIVSRVDETAYGSTRIVKISAADLEISAIGEVEGYVNNRYWLDEYQENLRVATVSGWNSYSNVFVLDEDLKQIGKIGNIAPGESIYSARFTGETGSIVTFRTVDPLFLLDLSDPTNPTISEGLKKEGVSMYLHPIEGTNYTIGLGRDTDEFGSMRGIEVVLFDYSGEEAVVVGQAYIIGEQYAYSEALYNPRAILYDKDKNVFAFAAEYSNDYYYSYENAYYIFGFENNIIEKRAEIKHFGTYMSRGVIIGDYVYALSNAKITSHSLISENIETVIDTE